MSYNQIQQRAIYDVLDLEERNYENIVIVVDEYAELYELDISDECRLHRKLLQYEVD